VDVGAVTGEGFIHGIIDNFKNEVMKTSLRRVSNVHAGPFANRLKTLENFDLICSVILIEHVLLKNILFSRKLLFFTLL
jgi:hypothetical protein